MLASTGIAHAQEIRNLRALPGSGVIHLTWNKPSTGTAPFSYAVFAGEVGGSSNRVTDIISRDDEVRFSVRDVQDYADLDAGTSPSIPVVNGKTYSIRVFALSTGSSTEGPVAQATVIAGTSTAPRDFTSSPGSFADALRLKWLTPAATHRFPITNYELCYYTTDILEDTCLDLGPVVTHTLSLTPGVRVNFILKAENEHGFSQQVEYQTTPIGAPVDPPTIALAGPDSGDPDDRITKNRGILITLASNFDAGRGDTWGISVDGGADGYPRTRVDDPDDAPNLRFGLVDGIYADDQVRVRQTVNTVISEHAGLAAFTFDATDPVITRTGAASIILRVGDAYTDLGATVTDNLDANIQSKLVVGGDTVNTATAGTYTVRYDATDHAGNTAVRVTREVIVQGADAPPHQK